MRKNILCMTDSYKYSHWTQYPEGTQVVYSYLEPRGGHLPEVVPFGFQAFAKEYLVGKVFDQASIDFAAELCLMHFGRNDVFNHAGFKRLYEKHQGRLPVSIKIALEGTVLPLRNAIMTVENTDEEFPWLTNFLETPLSQLWAPTTVASYDRQNARTLLHYLEATGTPESLGWKLQDFGCRGVESPEAAAILGAAHLIHFRGTDTVPALVYIHDYYHGKIAEGDSIKATEHSTMSSWGRENEMKAVESYLDKNPDGLIACVLDTWNIYKAVEQIGTSPLKEKIMARNGVFIVRPDSGYPPEVVCKVLEILGEKFGFTQNQKGYKVLDPHVRVIQGDGINLSMMGDVLAAMVSAGWSADNLAFGSGGALLQKHDRDEMKFAFKCSAIKVNGEWRDVYKDPITDPGKQSKRGRLMLTKDENGKYVTEPESNMILSDRPRENYLVEVFRDGELLVDQTFADIRKRAAL